VELEQVKQDLAGFKKAKELLRANAQLLTGIIEGKEVAKKKQGRGDLPFLNKQAKRRRKKSNRVCAWPLWRKPANLAPWQRLLGSAAVTGARRRPPRTFSKVT
jgi:hypothetical protein